MRQKKFYLRALTCAMLFLGLAQVAKAQQNPYVVCDVNQNINIDLGIDVVGQVLTQEGGYWDQISDPGDLTSIIKTGVSNVQTIASWAPGEYYFVYHATNNVCMTEGATSDVAIIRILETPKNFSHTIYACDGDDVTIDLADIVSYAHRDATFYNASHGTIAAGAITSELTIGTSFSGKITVQYEMPDQGVCNGPATITIDVVRGGQIAPSFGNNELNSCQENAKIVLNLQHAAGATILTGGVWSLDDTSVNQGETVAPASGIATFPTEGDPAVVQIGTYVFKYTWTRAENDCYESGSELFTVNVTADGISIDGQTYEDDICKTGAPNQLYNLLDGIGLDVPLSTGYWTVVGTAPGHNLTLDVSQGKLDVTQLVSGLYTFTYTVSEVASVCQLSGTATLELQVGDVGASAVYDGRVQLCAADLQDGATYLGANFKLSDHVMGLGAMNNVSWSALNPTLDAAITGTNADEIPYSALADLNNGSYVFNFSFQSEGCGSAQGEGSLFVTVTNNIAVSNEITLTFCRPDMPASVNLNQVVGAVLGGSWNWVGTAPANATLSGDNNEIFTETPGITTDESYAVELAAVEAGCNAPSSVKVTIVINQNNF